MNNKTKTSGKRCILINVSQFFIIVKCYWHRKIYMIDLTKKKHIYNILNSDFTYFIITVRFLKQNSLALAMTSYNNEKIKF